MQKGHPKGLVVLFFTEMWERFGFYTMLAILALYMDEYYKLPKTISGNIYGAFIALVYFTPLLGGIVADKWLGYGKSIVVGALFMAVGYLSFALDNFVFFFVSLGLICIGNGFFKPNISTMLGNLYGDNNPLKDNGFSIFYMGINVGAFFAPLVAAYLRNKFGWHYAFAAAGIGMIVSLFIFLGFKKHIQEVVNAKSKVSENVARLTPEQEKKRIWALVTVFLIVIFFWMGFHQNAYTLNFWARDCTNTTLSPEIFQAVNPFFVVFFTPLLTWFWSRLRTKEKEPSTAAKMSFGMILTATCFLIMMLAGFAGGDNGRVGVSWLISSYAVVTLGELCLSPMGLSLVSKMAPPRIRGLMMGGWFAATAIGNYLSGFLGSFWEKLPHSSFFGILVITSLLAFFMLYLVMNRLNEAFGQKKAAANFGTADPSAIAEVEGA